MNPELSNHLWFAIEHYATNRHGTPARRSAARALVEQAVQRIEENASRSLYGPPSVVSEVCAFYGVALHDLMSKTRSATVRRARCVAYWATRNTTKLSLKEIGIMFGRDHTTVLHGIRRGEVFATVDRFALERAA